MKSPLVYSLSLRALVAKNNNIMPQRHQNTKVHKRLFIKYRIIVSYDAIYGWLQGISVPPVIIGKGKSVPELTGCNCRGGIPF